MRLLHTTKLKLVEFVETGIASHEYAILSHTWGEEEVTFQDMQGELPKHKKGFSKLENSCIQAKKDGHEYIWIDTCCIDKSSSAELSEAINSMYRWYEEATICYAYLSDVPSIEVEDPKQANSGFTRSRWFRRGWTLQELIAPGELLFYCDCWKKLGTRQELIDVVTEVTKIDEAILQSSNRRSLRTYSVAQKMSWAAKRATTRLEDRAYSLLGLFDVNMPLLYGEGMKAFVRLQEEILKQTDDDSLFAHQMNHLNAKIQDSGSILAASPDCFSQSEDVHLYTRPRLFHGSLENANDQPSLVTNKGIQVYSFGCKYTYYINHRRKSVINGWLMILSCQRQNDSLTRPAILLKPLDSVESHFARLRFGALLMVRSVEGKPILDRWTDQPRFLRSRGRGREMKVDQVVPDFGNIHRRTIFVKASHYANDRYDNLSVTVEHILQPSSREFRLVGGSQDWASRARKLLMRFGGSNSSNVSGQLMFEEFKTGQKFILVVDLTILNVEKKDQSTEMEFQYQTWCTIIELHRDAPYFSLSDSPNEAFGGLKVNCFQDRAFVATSAIDDGYIVQATLSHENFLERDRFVLTVELSLITDLDLWGKMREKRRKLLDARYSSAEGNNVIGYITELDSEVLSMTSQIQKLVKESLVERSKDQEV